MKSLFTTCLLGISFFYTACSAQEEPLVAEGAVLTPIASDYSFTEGPAVNADGDVYFTDQPNNRILKWSASTGEVSVFMEPAGRSNGLYFDDKGHLLACADENFQLWSISPEKEVTVLADGYQGKELNGPNDLWIDPKGGVYFTDPYYQRPYWDRQQPEIKEQRVYYLAPDGSGPRIVAEDLVQPNGIIGSPDGSTLYVADIGDKKTYAYGINMEGDLIQKTLVTEMGSDGMTLDNRGNLYLTGDGVTVFNKDGKKILHIPVPQKWTANVTFGGAEQKTLFITAMNSVYTLDMNVRGVR